MRFVLWIQDHFSSFLDIMRYSILRYDILRHMLTRQRAPLHFCMIDGCGTQICDANTDTVSLCTATVQGRQEVGRLVVPAAKTRLRCSHQMLKTTMHGVERSTTQHHKDTWLVPSMHSTRRMSPGISLLPSHTDTFHDHPLCHSAFNSMFWKCEILSYFIKCC